MNHRSLDCSNNCQKSQSRLFLSCLNMKVAGTPHGSGVNEDAEECVEMMRTVGDSVDVRVRTEFCLLEHQVEAL